MVFRHEALVGPPVGRVTTHSAGRLRSPPSLAELCTLRFIEAAAHVAIVGPDLPHPRLGNIVCRRQHTVLARRADHLLKTLKHPRLNIYEAELRRLLAVDLLIIDDFGLDTMDATESRNAFELFTERQSGPPKS